MSKRLSIGEIVESVSITHKFDKPKLKFLNTADAEKGKIVNYTELPISELKGQAKKTIQKDDILFSEVRPKNKHYAYVDIEDCSDYVVSTKLMVLRKFNNNVDNKYFYYSLINDKMLDILQSRAENRICSFPQITFDLLSEYKIRIPEISEQESIAHILEIIDKKIELNNKINSELERIAKTLYEYWFVQFDFPDENERPYKSSGGKMFFDEKIKREIPIEWKVVTLSDIANITMGQSPSGSSYNTVGQGVPFHQGCANFGDKFPIAEQYTTEPSRMANIGEFLVSVRAPVGSLNIAVENCCIGRGLAAINSKTNDNEYLYQILQNFKNQFELRNSTGTTFGSITKDDLFGLLVIKPNDYVLKLYKNICKDLSQKQYNLFLENFKLTKIRDFLLPMLMNGQISIIVE